MNHIISPDANAQVAEYFGEAPANSKACALTADKDHCKTFHADDEAYFAKVSYWTTPTKKCLDARGRSARTTPTGSPPGRPSRADGGPTPVAHRYGGRPAPGSAPPPTGAAAGRPPRLAGRGLPGIVGRAGLQRPLALRPGGPGGGEGHRPVELPGAVARLRVPHDHDPHRRRGGGRDGQYGRPGLPDRLHHGQAGQPPGAGGSWSSPCCCRCGPATWPRSTPGARSWPRTGSSTGCSIPSGSRARARPQPGRAVARAHLPVAAVHDPADLRRPGADPRLAHRRLLRPRRLSRSRRSGRSSSRWPSRPSWPVRSSPSRCRWGTTSPRRWCRPSSSSAT